MDCNDLVVEAFSELAPRYEQTMDRELRQFWGLSYRQFIGQLVSDVPAGRSHRALDLATGTALIPLGLADRLGDEGRVVGLDITPAMLRHGQKRIEEAGLAGRIWLVCASAAAMPFGEGVFDTVICGLGTHHMEVPRMLAETRRVLKPGGRFLMADVGASAFWRTLCGSVLLRMLLIRYGLAHRSARARAEVEAFPNVRTAGEWRALLAELGFAQIEVREFRARRPWYPSALTIQAVALA